MRDSRDAQAEEELGQQAASEEEGGAEAEDVSESRPSWQDDTGGMNDETFEKISRYLKSLAKVSQLDAARPPSNHQTKRPRAAVKGERRRAAKQAGKSRKRNR